MSKINCLLASANTITARRSELLFARLFGRRQTVRDGAYIVKLTRWRGTLYMLDFRKDCR